MGQCISSLVDTYTPPAYNSEELTQAFEAKDEHYFRTLIEELKNTKFRRHKVIRIAIIPPLCRAVVATMFISKESEFLPIHILCFKCLIEISSEEINIDDLLEDSTAESNKKLIKKLVETMMYRKGTQVQVLACQLLSKISDHDCSKFSENPAIVIALESIISGASSNKDLKKAAKHILSNLSGRRDSQLTNEKEEEEDEDDVEDIIIVGSNFTNSAVVNTINRTNLAKTRQVMAATKAPAVNQGGEAVIKISNDGSIETDVVASRTGGGLLTQAYQRISPNSSPTTEAENNLNNAVRSPKKRTSLGIGRQLLGLSESSSTTTTKAKPPPKPPKPSATKMNFGFKTPMTAAPAPVPDSAVSTTASSVKPINLFSQAGSAPFLASIRAKKIDPDSDDEGPRDPKANISAMLLKQSGRGNAEPANDEGGNAGVKYKDHPVYGKYFRMKKTGVPEGGVKNAMMKDQVDVSIYDHDPDEIVLETSTAQGVPYKDHPIYSKYFKMLKTGVRLEGVQQKMTIDGIDPEIIVKYQPTDIYIEVELVCLKDHPLYGKHFKSIKMQVPKEHIKNKMAIEGLNPDVLDRSPDERVPINSKFEPKVVAKSLVPKSTIKKKKFHWDDVDASRIGGDSLWAAGDDGDYKPTLDQKEFNQLFVEDESNKKGGAMDELKTKAVKLLLPDGKRSQNGNISLARIKMPFAEIRKHFENMYDEAFTTDQLVNLLTYLPSAEEAGILARHKDKFASLGTVEKYMITMLDFPTAAPRIQCMMFKQQHRTRYMELKANLSILDKACEDVKQSVRLKKVFRTILVVGNQMNDADKTAFSVNSLLKLGSTKAVDQKTTLLHYLVNTIHNNDESTLSFSDDLANVGAAVRIPLDVVVADAAFYHKEYDDFRAQFNLVERQSQDAIAASETLALSFASFRTFCEKCTKDVTELDKFSCAIQAQYSGLLAYLSEDPSMKSEDFFTTLNLFITEFNAAKMAFLKTKSDTDKKKAKESAGLDQKRPVSTPISSGAIKKKNSPTNSLRITTPIAGVTTTTSAYKKTSPMKYVGPKKMQPATPIASTATPKTLRAL